MPLLTDSVRQLAAAMIVAALIITTLIIGQTVLIPLAGAIIISFILAPVVRRMTRLGVPRGLSVTGIVAIVLFLLVSAGTLLSVELLSITSRMDNYRENLAAKVRTVSSIGREDGILKRAAQSVDQLTATVGRELATPPDATKGGPAPEKAPIVVSASDGDAGSKLERLAIVLEPITRLGLLILFTIFLLLQHQDMRDRIVRVAGTDNLSETTSAMSEAGKRLSRLFLAQAIMSLSYGVLIGTVLWFIGVPGAIVWGVLAGLMRFVPFIGSFIAAVPPVILAAGVDPGWSLAIFTFAFFVLGEFVMGNVIEPLVLGRRVGLSPFAMIAAASFWTLVWGPVGLLLAAPLTMALVVVGRYIQGLSFISVLLGDEPALEPEQELYHRLLSSDALAAADQIETAMEDTSLAQASDRLVLPALALAANDVRTARLGEPQLETIGKTLDEATELHEDLASKPERDDEDAQVVIVAARGMVDVMAAKFLARVIEADTHQATRAIERSTGLTALALGGFNDGDSRPASIVIVSVAGLPKRQLELMAARASRSFPESGIIVLSAATVAEPVPSPGSASQAAKSGPSAPEAKHISTVVELIGNLKVQRGPSPATAEVDGGAAIATPAGAE